MLKKISSDKMNSTKMPSFFFRELQLINLRFLYTLKHKICLSKTVCGIFHFWFRFFFIKVYIFLQQRHGLFDFKTWFFFFNCYLAAPRPTLGHYWGDSLTYPMLITAFYMFKHEGHREPHNEVGSLSPTECLVGFELGIFQFLLQRLNPLGHSPQK